MRSPRGCRSPCRFKVRAPNRFNWHLRPWTQHKSLRRVERGVWGKWRRNNRIICICNTLLGQFLDSKWIWTHNDFNVSKRKGRSLTNSDGRPWKGSWTPHATVEYSQRKKEPHGSLEGTIEQRNETWRLWRWAGREWGCSVTFLYNLLSTFNLIWISREIRCRIFTRNQIKEKIVKLTLL